VINNGSEAITIRTIGFVTGEAIGANASWEDYISIGAITITTEEKEEELPKAPDGRPPTQQPDDAKQNAALGDTDQVDFLAAFLISTGKALPKTLDGEYAVFPVRIEGHDCRIYEWDDNALATLARGRHYNGYADQYKSFRWWPKCGRSLVRRTLCETKVLRSEP
jgi:hypothetical protein